MNRRLGKQTVTFDSYPVIQGIAAIVGTKEGKGPLGKSFDLVLEDDMWGETSWERAESKLQREAGKMALKNAGTENIDYILAGDLLNQCIGANYAMRDFKAPFFGLYGACSTMTESLSLGSMLIAGGAAERLMCVTSSHFCSSERQFRNPLEYGGQRVPSAQWTVTGAGAAVLSAQGEGVRVTHVTAGKIIDKGISDVGNMGAAMAPAAIDTLTAHFKDTGRSPSDYDLILTGDLGVVGSDILTELMIGEGYDIRGCHNDCGKMMFDIERQDVHAGGSGCGCCASVLCGHVLKEMEKGAYNRILVMATGALMNTMTVNQGETIPAIAHAVAIERQ